MIGNLLRKTLRWFKEHDVSYLYALLGEATLVLTFVFYALIARVLGPAQNGVFTAAVSLAGILAVFIQFGLPPLLTREVAGDPARASGDTLLFLSIQAINTLPVLLVLPFILGALSFTREGAVVCYIMIGAELLRSAKMLWRGVMKGHGWFHMEAISVGIERLFVALCAGIVLFATRNLIPVVATLVIARLMDNIGISFYLNRKVRIWSRVHKKAITAIYAKAYPFALHGLLWILYYQVDVIMLKAMAPAEEVGYYGAAFRALEIFTSLPRVVFYVAFTRFAETHARNPAELPLHAYQSVRMLMFFVLPVLVIAGYAQPIMIRLIFGTAYLRSIILMAVLLPSLSVKMFSILSEEYLLATGREKRLVPLMFAAAASNILINLILIPRHGALGAAIATGITECLYAFIGMTAIMHHGLQKVARRFMVMALPCAALVIAPSFLTIGDSPAAAIGLSVPCVLSIVFLMRRAGLDKGRH